MKVDLRYLGKSEVVTSASGARVKLAPNLARAKVFLDAELAYPLRFREAMSALHDVVVGDLRVEKRDKSAYEAWKAAKAQEEIKLRAALLDEGRRKEMERLVKQPIPPNLEADFRRLHAQYWKARVQWANELRKNDYQLFRHLVPCDPVITVAPDVVFFEGFSKDESAYGCLLVDRDALRGAHDAALGTTNVDYSLALYEHFQELRTYRPTHLFVDPTGFEVKVTGRDDYREEKIDLPSSWLRGFGQLQAAMTLPSRRVELTPEAVYSILAHLSRHREKTGPRSIRFRLTPGKAPQIVLDPWGVTIQCHGPAVEDAGPVMPGVRALGPYRAAPAPAAVGGVEEIKIWGRRRLFALTRVLPLCERIEVRLLGSGLPSVWIAHLGEMRFVLALSGWTANDWTHGSNLELLAGTGREEPMITNSILAELERAQSATLGSLTEVSRTSSELVLSSLHTLSKRGQVIYDYWAERFRYRQIMPLALSASALGPEHPELEEGRRLARAGLVRIERDETLPDGRRVFVFRANDTAAEAIFDDSGAIRKARCNCSFFYKNKLRAGPCRHLVALRLVAIDGLGPNAVPPEPPRRSAHRAEEVVSFDKALFAALKGRVTAQKDISDMVEEAWDLVFARLGACRSWKEAWLLAGPERPASLAQGRLMSSNLRQEALWLHADVIHEVHEVAKRLGASPSAVVNLAWIIAQGALKKE